MIRRPRWTRSGARVLPDFVIVGTQKGGTSSLYAYLCEHPLVARAARKEVHFFDLHYANGVGWYRSQFPTRRDLAAQAAAQTGLAGGGRAVTGEASPYYLFHPLAAERMARVVPSTRVIALLRDPVDRALSHYHHAVRLGVEDLSLEAAIDREAERLAGEEHRLVQHPDAESFPHRQHSYLARGRYLGQLQRFEAFRSSGRLLVLRSEDLFDDPQRGFDETLAFLGLPPWRLADVRARNTGEYSGPDAAVAARLRAYFEPHNRALYEYLGRDLGW